MAGGGISRFATAVRDATLQGRRRPADGWPRPPRFRRSGAVAPAVRARGGAAGAWQGGSCAPHGWAPPPVTAGASERRDRPAARPRTAVRSAGGASGASGARCRPRRLGSGWRGWRGWRRIPRSLYALPAATAAVWLFAALTPQPAAACAVCFGTADPASMEGLQAGILLLLGMVALVFAGVGGFLLAARRRIQRLQGRPTEAP